MVQGIRLIRHVVKPLVFAASLSPFVFLLWDAAARDFNANPFNAIVRSTGFWSLRFLCLTLAITPLRWLTHWHSLVKFRRMFGLFSFFYGSVHTLSYVLFDALPEADAAGRFQPLFAAVQTLSAIASDLIRPFFWIGLSALLLMVPLAATSTAGMIRSLGGRRWQLLHRLIYPAAIASLIHTYWPLTARAPRYALIVGIIFLLRLCRGLRSFPLRTGRPVSDL
jgi:sulfoxide reductase heme-binding subunit YedZ